MTRDDETIARNFSEVLLAMRAAGEQGIHAPTIAQLAPFYPDGLPRGPLSVAATLRGLVNNGFVHSGHRFANECRERFANDETRTRPEPGWIASELNAPCRYWLNRPGRIAADIARLAREQAS